jgi:hypothetical protein
LFEWQFRTRNAGNQKSINLNADVFIDQMFPALPEAAADTNGRVPLDLSIYGPGYSGLHNLQRKIIKGGGYKNWRLDGEYINNPEDEPERYNILRPGDFAIFDFHGRIMPISAKLFLLAQTLPADRLVHQELSAVLDGRSMAAVSISQIQAIAGKIDDDAHPFQELTLDLELEDAALGGSRGMLALRRRPSTRTLGRDELEHARRAAEEVGKTGEELVSEYLGSLRASGAIQGFVWVSDVNAIAPYDFLITLPSEQEVAVDVKSTNGEFQRPIHVSYAELVEMTANRRYDIYRVFAASEASASFRVAENTRGFAETALAELQRLPPGVRVDSVSVDTSCLNFGPVVRLRGPSLEDTVLP